jgi:hypothetical protein
MRWAFEEVVGVSAIHAAKLLVGDDGEASGDAVIEWREAEGFGVDQCTGVDERRTFAEGAVGAAAFEEGDEPGYG